LSGGERFRLLFGSCRKKKAPTKEGFGGVGQEGTKKPVGGGKKKDRAKGGKKKGKNRGGGTYEKKVDYKSVFKGGGKLTAGHQMFKIGKR